MTAHEQRRLAQIRKDSEKWIALRPGEAEYWNDAFLLRILDKAMKKERSLT